jgi:hypothetical protein
MRRIATILTILAGLLTAGLPAGAQGFFELLEDVPVMPALTPVNDAGIEFDAPSGRIVEAYAIGATSRGAVTEFYRATLPQLGWQPGAGNVYQRESESLKIDFFGPDGEITVRFTVAPAHSGG